MIKPEILSPAGDRERLQAAVQYGADAVYLAGTRFGMRSACANFDDDALKDAVSFCHAKGVRVYVTCNILPHDADLPQLPDFLSLVDDAGADALIIADIGLLPLAKQYAPHCEVHISTQFGIVNYATARMLHDMGASRVVLARELSLDEIADIHAHIPAELELECFVHGAMCMSFSGRCMLSAYLTGRDANRGDCAQPCRWQYSVTEAHRKGLYYDVEETQDGTYLFNAFDMNMIAHLPELTKAGIRSFKLEGRAKASYYTAVVTNAYRMGLDAYFAAGCPDDFRQEPWLINELNTVSHRPYGTGFYFGSPKQDTEEGGYRRDYEVAAVAAGWKNGRQQLVQRNRFFSTDTLEAVQPGKPPVAVSAEGMTDEAGTPLESASHAMMPVSVPLSEPLISGSFLRRKL